MAFLEQFSDEERDLIVALPYRVGLWVSGVDETGDVKSDFAELNELEQVIAEKSRGMFESAFVHEVMAETNARQDQWRQWSENLETVPEECTKAINVIAAKLEEKDIDGYRSNIMGIGLNVAKAFREFDAGAPFFTKLVMKIRFAAEAVISLVTRDRAYDAESVYNISYEEDIALTKLQEALHPGVDGNAKEEQH